LAFFSTSLRDKGEARRKRNGAKMIFWIISIALALAVAGTMVLVLLRRSSDPGGANSGEAHDLKIYRDQLRDIDRDLTRGVISDEDAEKVRVEVSRRILDADSQARATPAKATSSSVGARAMAAALVVVLVAGSAGLYSQIGSPGYGDLGLEWRVEMAEKARNERPDQQAFEANMPAQLALDLDPEYKELIVQLRETVTSRPDDLAGQQLLALRAPRASPGDRVDGRHCRGPAIFRIRRVDDCRGGGLCVASGRGRVAHRTGA